jgi:membrane glycosyltransferase
MPDRLTAPAVTPGSTMSLSRRRALFAVLVLATMTGILWLAVLAVPPHSAGAVLFLALFAVTLPWSVVGFWNAAVGLTMMTVARDPVAVVNPMAARVEGNEEIVARIAILMCIRNESPTHVTRNLRPLLSGLAAARVAQQFHLYLLSDSDFPEIVASEEARFGELASEFKGAIPITYRRRSVNAGFKAGNIRDFCDRWGGDHDLAITLDADSFMPAEGALRLVRTMQVNPTLGILQTLAIALSSASAFTRMFQFGMRLGMRSYTLGAAWWQGDCGPYWGHNAILRLEPFIAHCRLPLLPSGGPLGGHILSHDQVEAALMRRAGYEVRVLPVEGMSWEENPPTLMEYIRRDLRWCQGNMQYWGLLSLPGLRPISRLQLAFAILMYLGSPAWMAMVALGALELALAGGPTLAGVYARPGVGAALLAIMLLMIFAPKLASALDVLLRRSARRSYGGGALFASNVAAEILFSFLLSPIMAFTHTLFLSRLVFLRRGGAWNSQVRESHAVPWPLAWAKLWPHTLAGSALIGAVAVSRPSEIGYALMAAAGLAISAPFAVMTAAPRVGTWLSRLGLGRIPEETTRSPALLALNLDAGPTHAPEERSSAETRRVGADAGGMA